MKVIIYFNGTNVMSNLNNTKKKHDRMDINLSKDAPHLDGVIETSYKSFPRQYVFTNFDDINIKQKFKIYLVELLKYLPVWFTASAAFNGERRRRCTIRAPIRLIFRVFWRRTRSSLDWTFAVGGGGWK